MNATDLIKFAINTLKSDSRYSDIDMSEGSVFYNLNILPFAILSKPVFDLNDFTLSSMNIENMTESQLDDFASPFLKRRSQTLLSLQVDIYLLNIEVPVEPLIILTTDEFRTSSNQVFNPIKDYIFAYDSLPLSGDGLYKVATIFTSSSNSYIQVLENSIKSTSNIHPMIAFVGNSKPSSSPLNAETNSEFIVSIKKALARKTDPTLDIIEAFPYITDSLAIGYGDPEMQRDIAVAGKDWSGHFGGMRDIYVKTPIVSATFTTTATRNATNNGYTFTMQAYKGYDWNALDLAEPTPECLTPWIEIDSDNIPVMPALIFDFENSLITNTGFFSSEPYGIGYTVEVLPDPEDLSYGKNYRFSQYENIRITVDTISAENETEEITLNYYTLFGIKDIQNYLNSPANRELCSNDLVKSFILVEVKKLVIVYDAKYNINTKQLSTTIADIINNWSSTESIKFTTLFKNIPVPVRIREGWLNEGAYPDIPYVVGDNGIITDTNYSPDGNYPSYATMNINNIDGSHSFYLSTNHLYPLVKSGLSATYRTCRYYINPLNITFVQGSW